MTSRMPGHLRDSSDLDSSDLDIWATSLLHRVIADAVAEAQIRVWLFGSRATGHQSAFSDFDIALETREGPVPIAVRIAVREAAESSPIPYEVEIVDLAEVSAELRRAVHDKGELWVDWD